MRRLAFLVVLLAAVTMPVTVYAEESAERGLLITPPRQYLDVDPGKSTKSSIAIANLTENEIDVTLTVQQFSVADYTYDYAFAPPKENWVSLETSQVLLKRTESRAIAYDITVPVNATPGGHYFTVFASMTPKEGKVVQAATVVYVSVSGELVKTSQVEKNSMPRITFGGDIPYTMDIKNTGNTHFFTYISGKLNGVSAQPAQNDIAHLLMPQTVRTVEGVISQPGLPGIYQAEYGFKDEDGHQTIFRQYILYTPFWFWALVIGTTWFIVAWLRWRRRTPRPTTDS